MSTEQVHSTVSRNESAVQVDTAPTSTDLVMSDAGTACRVYYAADGGIDEYRTFGRLID